MAARQVLIEKIERFVRKFYVNRLIQGVLIGAALWIVFYLLVNALEYFSWFSPRVRFILFLVLLAGSAAVLVFYFIIPLVNLFRFRKKMSLEQASLLIGRFFPEVQDKLLNTLQLTETSENSASDELLAATIEQRTQQLAPLRFSDAVDLKGNLRYLYVFLALLAVLVALVVFLPRFAVQPTQRIISYDQEFEKPLPYSVTLSDEAIETNQGSDVRFSIHVEGSRIPDAFYVKSPSGQQVFEKTSLNDYTYTFRNLFHDLTFQVVGGEYVSKPVTITVRPNPVLLSYQCRISYPPYIHRNAEVLQGKTRIIVPQGSKLAFDFVTRDSDSALIWLDTTGMGTRAMRPYEALTIEQGNASYYMTAVQSTSFEFNCRNAWSDGFDPIRFTVDVIPDAYPDIRVESFEEDLSSQIYFSGLLADDYGFSKLVCHCDIQQPVEQKLVLPVAFDKTQTKSSFFYSIHLDSLGVLPGQQVEVCFEVWDNDGFHGPKSKRSETFAYYKPSLAALDSVAEQAENDIMDRMAQKSAEAEKLKNDIERMLQELTSKKELDWSDKEKIKDLLQKQEQIEEEWNKLQGEQEKLSDFMKQHDLANEEMLKKQEKINELFEELIPEELKKMMEEIEKLLDEMPRDRMQELLRDMQKDNKKMQDLLDRNLSLLEQLKMEKELNELMDQLNQLGEELSNETDTLTSEEAKEAFEEMMQQLDELKERNEQLTDPFNIQKDEAMEQSIENDLDQGAKKDAGKKMQQMANNMMNGMMMGGMEQMGEDAHLIRVLLENVVRASHQQETLMNELGHLRTDDPSLRDKIAAQKELSANFSLVEDSLRAIGQRQTSIQNFVFDELANIDQQTELALKNMNDLHFSMAVNYQHHALQSMNNLSLMLAESLEQMEMSMSMMGSKSSCNRPNQQKQQGQSMQQMQQLQQQLGKQLEQLQKQMQQSEGMPSLSEEFARMAAEQEMIRQQMQQMLDEMKRNGQVGDDGLNQIIKDMEQLEEDLVNKRVNRRTIERNQQILSRMLESEKAQQKREQEEKRKSNEYKGSKFDRTVDELFYKQQLKKNQEFLQESPVRYQPYFQSKINEYYLKKNQ